MRTCKTCGKSLPTSDFQTKSYRCKECMRPHYQSLYRERKKHHLALQQEWEAARRVQPSLRCKSCGVDKPPTEFYAKQTNCKDCHRENVRRRRAANPSPDRARSSRRRAKMGKAAVFMITERDVRRVYSSPCWACGATGNTTWDHVVPLSRGGSHGVGNALPLCFSCNASKRERLLVEWRYAGR